MTETDPPRATYRMQLTRAHGFHAAAATVPYLARLGVSHCYFSPYLKTRPGSDHGYDVIDHSTLNPELGDASDYDALCATLTEHGLGQILDIVPNHIGVMGSENRWWLDVLENGQASPFADYFDIDWRPITRELSDRVLVPVLGQQYGHALLEGDLRLEFDERAGEFSVFYFEHRFPLDPATYPRILQRIVATGAPPLASGEPDVIELESIIRSLRGLPHHSSSDNDERRVRAREAFIAKRRLADLCASSPPIALQVARQVASYNGVRDERETFTALHELLEAQPYRLAYWRVAADEINYRRFFDINDLAGLRTQNEEVLEATHRQLLNWVAEGKIHGFRIDHPDGLHDPRGYLRWLKRELTSLGRPNHYVVVEKILAAHEHLPEDWPVHGTTGYEFAFAANGLFIDAAAEHEFERTYRSLTRENDSFEAILDRCKRRILQFHLSSELTVLTNRLNRIAKARLETRDFTANALRGALLELIVSFPVYRSYVAGGQVSDQDRHHIEWAVSQARQTYEDKHEGIFAFIRRLLLADPPPDANYEYRQRAAEFTAKFQQLTAPVMAKALEDTCFYRYTRLLSLNDVGSDPRRFGTSLAAFHRLGQLRAQYWPHSMLTTSTHDSKRSEDVRARLNVLTEIPRVWRSRLTKWRRLNQTKRRHAGESQIPSLNEEYLFYQTLVGTWPVPRDDALFGAYSERLEAYMLKALREAKVNTSWANQNVDYETAVLAFVKDILTGPGRKRFIDDLDEFVGQIALPGYLNGLGQTLLKLASPGVPDIYQGNELWDFSLVDPDNRRPVDYATRDRALAELEGACADAAHVPQLLADLCDNLADGRAKLYLTWRALTLRARDAVLFERGSYVPLEVRGAHADHVCAFARQLNGRTVVAAVGRWFTKLADRPFTPSYRPLRWGDTAIVLPTAGAYENVLTLEQATVTPEAPTLTAERLFGLFPVALLASV